MAVEPLPPTLLPPPPPVVLARDPRAGELTPRWRFLTALTWIAVAGALGAVWRTSDQLGLSTWWIGPRGQPHSRFLQVLPFVPAVLMTLAAVNHIRRVAWLGVVAAATTVALGVGDLGRVARLGVVEIAIGVAAALMSLASLTGTYRPLGDG